MQTKRDIWVVEQCSNPSTEYYILPAMKVLGFENRIRILNNPPQEFLNEHISVFFVRYLSKDWVNFINRHRNRIKKIFYFMDDDLFDLNSWKGLPLKYIKKIYMKAYRWKESLLRMQADFFVSTEYLAQKYSHLNPLIIPAYPIFEALPINKKNDTVIVFYHGTASHKKEIDWLYDIVKVTTSKAENIVYEIIGDSSVYNQFRALEKIIVVHPMKWDVYKRFLLCKNRHIGLVPILGNDFNRARGYTKLIEIISCGGTGIYSKETCYEKVVDNETDGIVLFNDKDKWIDKILMLAKDDAYRVNIYLNSFEKLKKLKELAEEKYKGELMRRLQCLTAKQ